MPHVLWKINPARHVMGRRDPLDLLVSPQTVPNVLKAETEQQVAKDGFLGVAVKNRPTRLCWKASLRCALWSLIVLFG